MDIGRGGSPTPHIGQQLRRPNTQGPLFTACGRRSSRMPRRDAPPWQLLAFRLAVVRIMPPPSPQGWRDACIICMNVCKFIFINIHIRMSVCQWAAGCPLPHYLRGGGGRSSSHRLGTLAGSSSPHLGEGSRSPRLGEVECCSSGTCIHTIFGHKQPSWHPPPRLWCQLECHLDRPPVAVWIAAGSSPYGTPCDWPSLRSNPPWSWAA